jgi:hypothetical protein
MASRPGQDLTVVDEPPEAVVGGQVVDWKAIQDKAHEHPGKWVQVPVPMYPGVASRINAGRYGMDELVYEATSRGRHDVDGRQKATIYLRVRP